MRMNTNRKLAAVCVGIVAPTLLFCGCTDVNSDDGNNTSSTSSVSTTQSTSTIESTTTTSTTTATTTVNTTTTTKSTTTTTITTAPPALSGYQISGVPVMHQMPDYPTGCESISTVLVLNYWGEAVTADDFIDNHLQMSNRFYWQDGVRYGPNPYEVFVGNPRSNQSYGCMAPVIEKALVSYFGTDERVVNTTGTSMKELCDTYIDNDMPVLLWVTIGMIDTYTSDQWYAEDGTKVNWQANEHCMVLIGYDDNYYYLNDPYRGTVKKYAKWLVEKRYGELGYQSLVVTK